MEDSLGNRMKDQYESRTRYFLPRRTYTIVRVDGKAFHTFTKAVKCEKPFDIRLEAAMNTAGLALCKELQGVQLAYLQSDEISLLLTDFESIYSDAYFDGNVQKIVSVAASIATGAFNLASYSWTKRLAHFDARVFTIPDPVEVENYFIWRQQDATRNSVQMLGRKYFSHKELEGLSNEKVQDKLHDELGINWNDLPPMHKRGRTILKPGAYEKWTIDLAIPVFTQMRGYLRTEIPTYGEQVARDGGENMHLEVRGRFAGIRDIAEQLGY